MNFDLADLRLFLAVVDAGSITHGAANAGLSLPAASERLRNMELSGGVELLSRGRRGVSPTEAGEALAHHARTIEQQISHMRGELSEYAGGLRATIRLVANTAAITTVLPERLALWMAARPRIDVDLKERQSADIARAIAGGLAEIGILSDAVDTTGLELRPFAVDRLVVIGPAKRFAPSQKDASFKSVCREHFIGLTDGALQMHIEAHAHAMGLKLKMRVQLRTFEGICAMVAEGVGLGIVPDSIARRYQRAMKLSSALLSDDWGTRRLMICTHPGRKLTRPARELADHLASADGNSSGS